MKRSLLCILLLVVAGSATAETAFQFAAPGLRAPDDPNVNGVRFAIFYGTNQRVRGVDFGLLSLSETADLSGLGLVLGVGKVTGTMSGGAAISLINIHSGSDRGLNAAFINRVNDADKAVDIGFVNIADAGTMVDIGGVNVSDASTVQLGFLNVTQKIRGPVFPIFNFPKP